MKPRGTIYDSKWKSASGEVILRVGKAVRFAFGILRGIGSGFIVAGLAGIILTFQPVFSTELEYRWGQFTGEEEKRRIAQQEIIKKARAEEEEKEKVRELAKEIGLTNTHFSIYIPRINAKSEIIENISAADQKEYLEALKRGVAHASGSVFPGMEGGTFLFAHSTDAPWNIASYNAVFYLLRELDEEDEVFVFFLDKLYKYEVVETHIVEPSDVSWLTESRQGDERLVLQTCWPPGTTLKRMIVVAEPAKD